MQKKSIKYVLVGSVVFIWAAVMFQLFAFLSKNKNAAPTRPFTDTQLSIVGQPDSFSLLLHYPDPFLTTDSFTLDKPEQSDYDQAGNTLSNGTSPQSSPPEEDIHSIKYLGMISNPKTGRRTAIITFRNQERIIQEGKQIDLIVCRKITLTQIELIYKGKKYTIARS